MTWRHRHGCDSSATGAVREAGAGVGQAAAVSVQPCPTVFHAGMVDCSTPKPMLLHVAKQLQRLQPRASVGATAATASAGAAAATTDVSAAAAVVAHAQPQHLSAFPTGTGDCCAPKLLHAAAQLARHDPRAAWRVQSLLEFWYGSPPNTATRQGRAQGSVSHLTRKHLTAYGSCDKCGSVLGTLLCDSPSLLCDSPSLLCDSLSLLCDSPSLQDQTTNQPANRPTDQPADQPTDLTITQAD